MINLSDPPRGFRDVDWLLFFGWVSEKYSQHVVLQPAEDRGVSITMASQDVYDFPAEPPLANAPDGTLITPVFVRRFARASSIEYSASPQFQARVRTPPNRGNTTCSAASSYCFGNVEFCCDTHVAVSACYGRWRC